MYCKNCGKLLTQSQLGKWYIHNNDDHPESLLFCDNGKGIAEPDYQRSRDEKLNIILK